MAVTQVVRRATRGPSRTSPDRAPARFLSRRCTSAARPRDNQPTLRVRPAQVCFASWAEIRYVTRRRPRNPGSAPPTPGVGESGDRERVEVYCLAGGRRVVGAEQQVSDQCLGAFDGSSSAGDVRADLRRGPFRSHGGVEVCQREGQRRPELVRHGPGLDLDLDLVDGSPPQQHRGGQGTGQARRCREYGPLRRRHGQRCCSERAEDAEQGGGGEGGKAPSRR